MSNEIKPVYCVQGYVFGSLAPECHGIEFCLHVQAQDPDDALFQMRNHLGVHYPNLTEISALSVIEVKMSMPEHVVSALSEDGIYFDLDPMKSQAS